MITLYKPPVAWGTPSMSPFAGKLESWLRWSALPYQVRGADPRKAPRGKVPFIRDEDGAVLGDTQLIIEHLGARTGGLDGWLGAEAAAVAHATRRMVEESTYWGIVHIRWARDEGFTHVSELLRGLLPVPGFLTPALLPIVRRTALNQLHAQGTGRHSAEVVDAMLTQDLNTLEALLGDKPYLMGERPCTADASVWAMLNGVLGFPSDTAPKRHAAGLPRLVAYHNRVQAELWPQGFEAPRDPA